VTRRTRTQVDLRIERLVVEGVDPGPGGAERVRQALAAALAERLTTAAAADALLQIGTDPAWPPITVRLEPAERRSPTGAAALGRRAGTALGARLAAREATP
jgi:hypothetical protein